MAEDGVIFGPEAIRQITDVVRIVLSQIDPSFQLGMSESQETRKPTIFGYTDAAGAIGTYVTVSIYKRVYNSTAETDTGKNIEAWCGSGAVNANTRVIVQRFVWGWEIIQARCGN
jgi:hypothetical protein